MFVSLGGRKWLTGAEYALEYTPPNLPSVLIVPAKFHGARGPWVPLVSPRCSLGKLPFAVLAFVAVGEPNQPASVPEAPYAAGSGEQGPLQYNCVYE